MKLQQLMIATLTLMTACMFGGGSSSPAPATAPSAPAPASSVPGPGATQPMSPADPRPVMTSTAPAAGMPSLFTRLGGLDAIRAVVHDFVGRVGADSRINGFFRGVDLANLERLLTEQICQASGGPCRYTGRTMRATHEGMNLTDEHFNALVGDLVAALDQFNVPAREKNELLTALGSMKGDIVGH